MLKFIIPGVIIAALILLIIIFRLSVIKYRGSTIRIFNKTLKGFTVNYVGKIVSEREQTNIIKFPYVNSMFLCRPSNNKEVKEEYYTYSQSQQRLYYLEDTSPRYERTNTEENSKYHEVMLKPFDKFILKFVFRKY